jgi:hypothetical protein
MGAKLSANPPPAELLEAVQATVGDAAEEAGIDEYAYSRGGFVPDSLKIDVDGGELGVLRSAQRLLTERRPTLIVETHSDGARACMRMCLLTACGFRPAIVNQRRLLPDHRPTSELNRWLVAA